MYKLMIVEDEPVIRVGIRHYFDWSDLGFHSIFEAEDGRQGLETAIREQPDLIITDIRMPKMDGLEMIEQLRDKLPQAVFVILTGYSEFEYARRALRIGSVHEYLVKPLQYEESLATIKKCILAIERMKAERQERETFHMIAEENSKYRASEAIKDLLEDNAPLDRETIRSITGFSNPMFQCLPLIVMAIPDKGSLRRASCKWRSTAERIAADVARSIAAASGVQHYDVFTYYAGSKLYALTIMSTDALHFDQASLASHTREWLRQAGEELQAILLMSLGRPTEQLSRLGSDLKTLDKLLLHRFFQQDNMYMLCDMEGQPETIREAFTSLEERHRREILNCLEEGHPGKTKQLMKELSQFIAGGSPERMLLLLQEIVGMTLRFAQKHGIQVEGIYSDRLFDLSCTDDFFRLGELLDWFADWILHLNDVYRKQFESRSQTPDKQLFEQIKSFICQHISEEITLQVIADRFFYNPSYLSRLFKSKLNKNFIAFLTEIRIRYARQYLEDPQYLVTDVCAMCGYKSYKHFVKMFRLITGMTPTEYRKRLGL